MKKGFQALLNEANAEIRAVSVHEAYDMAKSDDVVLVDIRDIRELGREGQIKGAIHAPRGMLEFWVDPESPYHREVFASGKTFVFSVPPAGGRRLRPNPCRTWDWPRPCT